jgi:hypothetical protein
MDEKLTFSVNKILKKIVATLAVDRKIIIPPHTKMLFFLENTKHSIWGKDTLK